MEVQILSTKLIKPASPTPPNFRSLKISSLDQLQPSVYVSCILYYEANGDENVEEKSKNLQKSLSETLTLFYPLAGRYVKDNLLVDCNDDGVEYVEAQVGGQLAQLLQGEIKAELLNHLLPNAIESGTTPLLLVQINMFECGGLAIGLRIAHRISDGFTRSTFINAWATACRTTGINELIRPRFDLASYFPPIENISAINLLVSPLKIGAKIVTRRFVFDRAAISNLKDIASKDVAYDSTTKRQPTRVVVVTALIWKALISVAQAKHGHLRASFLCHALNMRGKTALPIDNSCGNFYTKAIARFDGDDNESKMELHELAGVLDDGMRNTLANCMKLQSGDDLFSMVTNSLREIKEVLERGEIDIHMFTSWCRFPTYEADFGWGKPVWVTVRAKNVEITHLVDTKDGDGIEAWVSLDEKDMLLFQHHPDIIAFTSNFSSISKLG